MVRDGLAGCKAFLYIHAKFFESLRVSICVLSVLTIKGTFVQAIYTCLDGVLRKTNGSRIDHAAHSHKEFTQSKLYTNTHILGSYTAWSDRFEKSMND